MTDENGIQVSDYIATVQHTAGGPVGYEILISPEDDERGSHVLLDGAITGCIMSWTHPDRYARCWAPTASTAYDVFYAFTAAGITMHPKPESQPS